MISEKMTLSEIEQELKDNGRGYLDSVDYFKMVKGNRVPQNVKLIHWDFDGTIHISIVELIVDQDDTDKFVGDIIGNIKVVSDENIRNLFRVHVASYDTLSTLDLRYEKDVIEKHADDSSTIDWESINKKFIENRFLYLLKHKLITRKKINSDFADYIVAIESRLPRVSKDNLLKNSTTYIDEIITEEFDGFLDEYLKGKTYYRELVSRKTTDTHIIYAYRVRLVYI